MLSDRICFLIDNDEVDRKLFGIAIKQIDSSHALVNAAQGVEALLLLSADRLFTPSFKYVDRSMPPINGWQYSGEMRPIDRPAGVPLYNICATSTEPWTGENLKAREATGFILKPSGDHKLTLLLAEMSHPKKLHS